MKKKIIFFVIVVLSISCVFATNTGSFSLLTEGAYYPKSNQIPGKTHFAPLTGPFSGLEVRATGIYNYIIPVPFSDNPLVKGNTLKLAPALEVSPVSIMPKFDISFTPIAFLVFSAGSKIGTGWDFSLMNVQGLATYNETTKEYDSLDPFKSYFYHCYFEGLFQFDLAAVVPGDWNHVVMQANYKVIYEGLINGGKNKNFWLWQGTKDKVSGWQYYSNIVLGYQMPLVLQMVALQLEIDGNYSSKDFPDYAQNWNPTFVRFALNPVFNFKFNDKHSLLIQCRFRTRRSLSEEVGSGDRDFYYTYAGREWYFDRIAFSYNIKF
ncbi:MAG: hypothetical protein E7062_00860 [Spirochaetaceae bacterium]|nr:hypothetical protein [Spirochaetaceae bacterium]